MSALMVRYRFRNILSVLLFSCDLVVTQESTYKSLGSTVELVCPIVNTTRDITWLGPSNYKLYAAGTDVSNEFSTQVEINVTARDKKSILLIHRFTKDKSGKFRCSDTFDTREFNLIIKRNPSDLVIVNATGQTITAVEGKEHNLECRVTSGQPGGNITWSTDGVVVARNGPSFVSNRLLPQRSDNGKIFKCEAFNIEGESILESSVLLEVFYIPKITFSPNQTLTVKEGVEAQLICINDGNDPDATTVWKRQPTDTIITQNDELNFKNVNRTDAGLYTCRVDTRVGVYEDNAKLVVQCKPYFVSSTENTQYGVYLKTAKIKIKFVSVPEYNRYDVYKNESRFTGYTDSVYRNMNLTDDIYGKNVTVKGSIISLQIQIDTLDDFSSYKIVVKNAIGCSNHTIKLVSASAPFMPKILRTVAKQTQISVLWKPGFNGGYFQWFIVEYQEIRDMYWENQTTNSSNSTVIGGLQPATKYLIRMFARNMIDESNRTEEILIQTDESVSETDLSAIVSLSAVILCLLIIAVYFRRGKDVNRMRTCDSMKCSSEIEQGEKESRELNYVEILFDRKPVYPFTIHGLDDKTNYVEIDFTQSADPLPDSDTDSESEK